MIFTKFSGHSPDGRRLYYKGGGGGSSSTVQNIPEELKPLATKYSNMAIDLSKQGYTPYGKQRYADLNDIQYAGINDIVGQSQAGSTMSNAEQSLNDMFGGNGNPYLDQMVGRAQDSVKSGFNTAAINSGSFGNSGLQESYGRDLGNVATQMYGQAYDADRNRQLQAIQMAPNIAYGDSEQLLNAGQILQDQDQQNKDFEYSQFQEKYNLPYKQLAAMSGVFGSNLGGSSETKSSGGGK